MSPKIHFIFALLCLLFISQTLCQQKSLNPQIPGELWVEGAQIFHKQL